MLPISAIRPFDLPEPPALGAVPAGRSAPPPAVEVQELPGPAVATLAPARGAEVPFDQVFGRLIGEVNGQQAEAGRLVQGVLSGDQVSLHQAVIAMEEAGLSFRLMVEVRNKLLEIYQELMRMQV